MVKEEMEGVMEYKDVLEEKEGRTEEREERQTKRRTE